MDFLKKKKKEEGNQEIFLDNGCKICYHILARFNMNAYPGVAQLVACLTGGQEAAGSSPVTRTMTSVL